MQYRTSYPRNIEPLVFGYPYTWYFDPPNHRISNYPWYLLSIVCWPPTHGIFTPYPWYIEHLSMVFWPHYPWYLDTPTNGILTPLPIGYRTTHGISNNLPMVFWSSSQSLIEPLIHGILISVLLVFWPFYRWHIKPTIHGILDPPPMVFWLPTHGISNLLSMVYRTPYPLYFDPLPIAYRTSMVYWTSYPWYIEPPTHWFWPRHIWHIELTSHGILRTLPIVFWPQYPWHIEPPFHGLLTPNHGISNLYPWYFDPLTLVFWTPYSLYFVPSIHAISNLLSKEYRTLYPW